MKKILLFAPLCLIGVFTNAQNTFPYSDNVRIGTRLPDVKLTINSAVHANSVKVDLAVQHSDYVFDRQYQLLILKETELYIARNYHPNNILAAKKVWQRGIDIGEMN